MFKDFVDLIKYEHTVLLSLFPHILSYKHPHPKSLTSSSLTIVVTYTYKQTIT